MEYEVVTLETMTGSCENCHRDFSMWHKATVDENGEVIEDWYECSECGHRED
jgi:DNA-directed RNA polymerase subunit M/transcription elongation factor TFIIS